MKSEEDWLQREVGKPANLKLIIGTNVGKPGDKCGKPRRLDSSPSFASL